MSDGALRGVAEALEVTGKRHLIATAIEHEAVLNTLKALARRGWKTTLLPVDETGIVALSALEAALTDDTALVSVIGLADILRQTGIAARVSREAFMFFGIACLLYLVLAILSSIVISAIENRYNRTELGR